MNETHLVERAKRRVPNVVVADDDLDMRSLVASALREDQCEVAEVEDGTWLFIQITVRLMRHGTLADLDLIVSDVRMPGRSGLEAVQILRAAGYQTPFILMTAFESPEIRAQARALGAVLFCKPFSLDDLRAAAVSIMKEALETERGEAAR